MGNYPSKKLRQTSLCLAFLFTIHAGGCVNYQASQYGVSSENVKSLRGLAQTSTIKLNVGDFSSYQLGRNAIDCHFTGPVVTPNQEPFEAYIRNALINELRAAGLFSEHANIRIDGYLESVGLDTSYKNGRWAFKLRISASDGSSFITGNVYSVSTSFDGGLACLEMARALPLATQDLLSKLFDDPKFRKLTRGQ